MSKTTYKKKDVYRKRAKELVSKMTVEEKVLQMLYNSPAIERLDIPSYNWWNEALHGVARAGTATMFPQAIGIAATFDEKLTEQVASVISTEGRAKFNGFQKQGDHDIYKGLTFWSPNVNIFRDPRWGRGHETYGEDPYLTGRLGVAFIKGIQGDDDTYLKAAACAKHFAVHSGPEDDRHHFNAIASKKDMFETYLPAFYACVTEGKVEAVMGAYNRTNGEPCCGSRTLLLDILRERWGFDGHVVSDCWAINDFHLHHKVTNTPAESAAMAVNNGCDLNCGNAFMHLLAAYNDGLVKEEEIDRAVTNLFTCRMQLGLFDDADKVPFNSIPYTVIECAEHQALNLETAKKSLVLLRNNGILPLSKDSVKTIGVIGPNAFSTEALKGNYHGQASQYITLLDGIREEFTESRILYADGCHLALEKNEKLSENPGDRIAEAICVAENSDVVVLCLGLDQTIEGEESDAYAYFKCGDKTDLSFPGLQGELLRRVTAVGKPVILVVISGSALDLREADKSCAAVVQAFYPGSLGGRAIAQMMSGRFSPSGRLPITFYEKVDDLPEFTDYSMKGRTYRYLEKAPLYPFGYGLSYTDFEYSGLKASSGSIKTGESVAVTVSVKNTGCMDGYEVSQLYVVAEGKKDVPFISLKGFKNTFVKKGESLELTFELPPEAFAFANDDGDLIEDAGIYKIYVGGSQPDARSVELTGKKPLVVEIEITGEPVQLKN